ncbi:MAG: DUF1934 family protein [Candidatus Izemoplasmatales bacterium]
MRCLVKFKMMTEGIPNLSFEGPGIKSDMSISFIDELKQKYTFLIEEDGIVLKRSGETPLIMKFFALRLTVAQFETEKQIFTLELKTNKVRLTDHQLEIAYDMVNDTEVLSSHHLTLDWKV